MVMTPHRHAQDNAVKNRTLPVLLGSALAIVACGGANNPDVFGGGADDAGLTGADATTTTPPGSDAATDGAGGRDGGSGSDGGNRKDAAPDAALDAGTLCTSTGGIETTSLCCKSVVELPNTCAVGACGCSPGNSHVVKICECPLSKCYDPAVGCRAP
jgi:hypothetical protein